MLSALCSQTSMKIGCDLNNTTKNVIEQTSPNNSAKKIKYLLYRSYFVHRSLARMDTGSSHIMIPTVINTNNKNKQNYMQLTLSHLPVLRV